MAYLWYNTFRNPEVFTKKTLGPMVLYQIITLFGVPSSHPKHSKARGIASSASAASFHVVAWLVRSRWNNNGRFQDGPMDPRKCFKYGIWYIYNICGYIMIQIYIIIYIYTRWVLKTSSTLNPGWNSPSCRICKGIYRGFLIRIYNDRRGPSYGSILQV